jgi:hypothetical protein
LTGSLDVHPPWYAMKYATKPAPTKFVSQLKASHPSARPYTTAITHANTRKNSQVVSNRHTSSLLRSLRVACHNEKR